MMRIRLGMAAMAIVMTAALASSLPGQATPGFVVIVNESNPVTELSRENLSSVFLKRQIRWSHGPAIAPVDQSEKTAVRQRFSDLVHGRSATAIRAYWQQQVFSGRDVPPVEKATDQEVVQRVAETPGGIGYVRAGVRLPRGVKAIRIRDL